MESIILFGGSFDPIHFGHLELLVSLSKLKFNNQLDQKTKNPQKIIITPTADIRTDKPPFEKAYHRVAMCRLAIEDYDFKVPVEISNRSVNSKEDLGTFNLLRDYQKDFPSNKFYLAIGSDLVDTLPKWKNHDLLRKEAEFIVIKRAGASPAKLIDNYNIHAIIEDDLPNISSSKIREILKNKQAPLTGLIPDKVLGYIIKNNLYEQKYP